MRRGSKRLHVFTIAICIVTAVAAVGQQNGGDAGQQNSADLHQLQREIEELRQIIGELRTETAGYRAEVRQLQQDLKAAVIQQSHVTEQSVVGPSAVAEAQAVSQPQQNATRLAKLEDDVRALSGKVDDQYQTKVESGSKYRVRLSGIALFSAFTNRGAVDSIDIPQHADVSGPLNERGSVGASLRQSQIGLEVFGPDWLGARVDANVHFDFAGGFPSTTNGVLFGMPRLRTGTINFRWANTTLVAGQDAPFVSALSPTSLASLAQPAFSYAGNLWYWVPQVRIEHRIQAGSFGGAVLSAGLLDPMAGDTPASQFERMPQAGEVSRSPAYAARVGWVHGRDDAFSVGVGGYFSPQNWGAGRDINGWAGTLDWEIPLASRLSLRGEFYRGSAIGGLGAAGGHSILASDALSNPNTRVRGLDTLGGWSQVRFRATTKLEFNGGYGQDNPFSRELRQFSAVQTQLDPELGINRDIMLNSIYHPRSNLLLSLEYRHFYSARLLSERQTAEHVNAAIGVLF